MLVFKKKRPFFMYDIVYDKLDDSYGELIHLSEKKGLRAFLGFPYYIVRSYKTMIYSSFLGDSEFMADSTQKHNSRLTLKLYEPEVPLVRPLKEGDTIVLAKEFKFYKDRADLKYRGGHQTIKSVETRSCNPYQFIYVTAAGDWLDIHIDTKETNALIVHNSKLLKKDPVFPII